MIDAFRVAFQELIDASLLGDPQRFAPAVGQVYQLASRVPASEREIALEALGPIFSGHHTGPGVEADLTVVAGALVEMGTAPGATGIEVLRLLRETGKAAGMFLYAWDKTGGGDVVDPDAVTAADEKRVAAVLDDAASVAALCWWTARRYGLSARSMLSSAQVRAAVRRDTELHEDLLAVAAQLSAHLSEYGEVAALLRMDEVSDALVLDRASRRAFRVRFEGIGDNFQLHTLLADALIGEEGQGLEGRRPDPRWVAAFRNAATDPQASVVSGWWNLVGANGAWVWNEGTPTDIPLLRGERLLVLEEQTYPRSWSATRLHPLVEGRLWVTEELDAERAAHWWSLLEPQETLHPAPPQPSPATAEVPATRPDPEPEPVASEPEPASAPTVQAATELIPALTDADIAAHDAAAGEAEPPATPRSDGEEEEGAPGSRLLPPLPPGVSDSSGWGPSWR